MDVIEAWLVDRVKSLQAQVNDLSASIGSGGGSGGGGSSGPSFLSGSGAPEGVVTGEIIGQTYLDTDDNALYSFNGVVGENTGWH